MIPYQNCQRPLKIAFFSDSAFPILNGVSVSLDLLTSELRNLGHSVELFTTNYPNHIEKDPNTHRCRFIHTPWSGNYPLAVPPFTKSYLEFRSKNFDIVHTHTPWTLGYLGLRWAKAFSYPVVSTYHTLYHKYSHYIPYFSPRFINKAIRYNTHYYYNQVKHVIVPSHNSQKWLQTHKVKTPTTVIPTAVTKKGNYFRSECRNAMGINPNKKILLYAGRLAKEKNLDTLISGVAKAIQYDKKIRLWIVGEGPYEQSLKTLVREKNIGDFVKFVGSVSPYQIGKYYAVSDLFVFCSTTETQGLVINEAMSYGIPSIVVNKGGAAESVENEYNGFLISNDEHELSRKILSTLHDQHTYSKLSRNSLKKSCLYTPENMCRSVLKVYASTLNIPFSKVYPEDELKSVNQPHSFLS